MSGFPFSEKRIQKNKFIREFKESVNTGELVWHQDREDRVVVVESSNGWKIQYENKLPVELRDGDILYIKAYTYHRVIKGSGNLKVVVEKLL